MKPIQKHPASYRDSSGFLFYKEGKLYRQINLGFKNDFIHFQNSGLYDSLIAKKILIPHQLVPENLNSSNEWFQTIEPEQIPFISYPYEWCFDMWKDAALITLEAAKEAMKYQMIIKDASAFNVQWHQGKMTFIDTLSFERYNEKMPWIAYRQFCEHFLAPLALMHYLKYPIQNIFSSFPEGIPLHFTKKLLPFKSNFDLHIFLHLHLQANQMKRQGKLNKNSINNFSQKKLTNIIDSLTSAVNSLTLDEPTGVWSDYYHEAEQRENYLAEKKRIIDEWINKLPIVTAIDAGANEGLFSDILSSKGIYTISTDFDHYSINRLYKRIKSENNKNIHPLILDLSNPSPSIGVNNEERASFTERTSADMVLALALIHHLAIGKNMPFASIAQLFRSWGKSLIIEFVPKSDEKVQSMLIDKKDIYHWYTEADFKHAFAEVFNLVQSNEIGNSGRTLYLMEAR